MDQLFNKLTDKMNGYYYKEHKFLFLDGLNERLISLQKHIQAFKRIVAHQTSFAPQTQNIAFKN